MAEGQVAEGQVAVLIDFENVGLSSVQWLFDQLSDVGRILIKRAYADWSTARNKGDRLHELGIEPIHLFHSSSGKNSSDIRLAIDAIELLHLSSVDTFVIVSADSDFVPLVGKLRAAGKIVIGAGPRATASRTLVGSCDKYFYLSEKEPNQAETISVRPVEEGLLIRAVKASMDDEGLVMGSRLHQNIKRLDPSFDFRNLGYSTFTNYLNASDSVKVIRPQGKGDVKVELNGVKPDDSGDGVKPDDSGDGVKPDDSGDGDPSQWGPQVDEAWSKKAPTPGQSVYGQRAASDAAKALGVDRLKDSGYKTLERLLRASEVLSSRWKRDGGKIIRK